MDKSRMMTLVFVAFNCAFVDPSAAGFEVMIVKNDLTPEETNLVGFIIALMVAHARGANGCSELISMFANDKFVMPVKD